MLRCGLFSSRTNLASTAKAFLQPLTSKRFGHELAPRYTQQKKKQKGRVTVRTGGSLKGNKLMFGDYGMRLKSEGLRVAAAQLSAADKVLSMYVRRDQGIIYRRLCTNIAICIKGNATRMGKGKGAFDHWAARVPTGKVVFEVANINEHAAKEALRKACDKLPGVWEFVRKASPLRVGLKTLVDHDDAKVNYLEEIKKNPTKKYANRAKSQLPEYLEYRGRK